MKHLLFSKNYRAKLPVILQDEVAECGHACILMISNFYGHKLDMPALRKLYKPSQHGVTMLQINTIINKLSFKTRALKVELEGVQYLKTPAILHWNLNHFVVLKKVTSKRFIVHDPAIGVCSYSLNEFSNYFTGIALEVSKPPNFKRLQNFKKLTLIQIARTTPLLKKSLVFLVMLSFGLEILTLLNPLLLQYITDNVLGTNSNNNLYTLASGFIFLIFIKVLAEYARENLILFTTTNFTESFTSSVFKHLLSLPMQFFSSRHQGDIQSKFQTIDHIKTKISSDFVNTLFDGIMFILTLGVMLIYSWKLSLIVCMTILIYISMRYFSYQNLKNQSASAVYLHAKLASQFLETIKAIMPIKIYRKEDERFNTWHNGFIDALNSDICVAKKQIIYKISNHFLFHIEHIIVICCGANMIIKQKISIGMLLAFLAYRQMLVDKSSSFIQNIYDYQLLNIHLKRLSDIIYQPTEISNSAQKISDVSINCIKLENISFHYDEDSGDILNNFSLTIQRGEKLAITGASGRGKSTILKIMLGLLTPCKGKILINDIPIANFGVNNYKDKIAAVMQDDQLLSGSILDNISFFAQEADMQQVYASAEIAQIHSTISELPMGYETLLGDMGSVLSGGQKQRILLARALYKKPQVLFLDEASSHLDKNNEFNINQQLKEIDITQIIVAHRQETTSCLKSKCYRRVISLPHK